MTKRVLTSYAIHSGKLHKPVKLMVVSDLHNQPFEDILTMLDGADGLLVPGDVTNRYLHTTELGIEFLREAAKRLPTFFSMGNHDKRFTDDKRFFRALTGTGATILDNRYVRFGELIVCGWYRPSDGRLIKRFEREEGCRVLLCHKPEDYIKMLRTVKADLIVAGHAHGGQMRLFGRGLYAPGQGVLPRYTKGVVDGRLVISTGASNSVLLPRLFNPAEVVAITLD